MTTRLAVPLKKSAVRPQHRKAVRALCEELARILQIKDADRVEVQTYYAKRMEGLRIGKIIIHWRDGIAYHFRHGLIEAPLILAAENFLDAYVAKSDSSTAAGDHDHTVFAAVCEILKTAVGARMPPVPRVVTDRASVRFRPLLVLDRALPYRLQRKR